MVDCLFDEEALEALDFPGDPFADDTYDTYTPRPLISLAGTKFSCLTELTLDEPGGTCWSAVEPGPLARACPKLRS